MTLTRMVLSLYGVLLEVIEQITTSGTPIRVQRVIFEL
jgi:hypothetical protein